MECDYYIDKYLVIEYISENGRYCTLTTDLSRQKKYIRNKSQLDSGNEFSTGKPSSYQRKLERKIEKHTYRQIIFKKDEWANDKYKTEYTYRLKREFPYVYNLKKMYIDFTAYKSF